MMDLMIRKQAAAVLCGILESGADIHRCAAAQALVHVRGGDVAAALRKALRDEDVDVRADAAAALGAMAVGDSAEALMENLLGDPNGDVKKAALGALVALRHEPVTDLLRHLAVERTGLIAWDDDAFYADGWDDWLDLQVIAIRGIGEMGDVGGIDAILAALDDEGGQDVSAVAIAALLQLGTAGARALAGVFAGGNGRLRRRIAKGLVGRDDPVFSALLDACLKDRDGDVRLAAAQVLAGRAAEDPRLEALMADPDPRVRSAVLTAAGTVRAERVLAALTDGAAAVRKAAFGAIARTPEAFDGAELTPLLRAAFDDDVEVALAAAMAWAAVDPEAALPMLGGGLNGAELPVAFRAGLVEPLRRLGPAASRYLAVAAVDESRTVRLAALTLLADFAAEGDVWPNLAGEILLHALAGDLLAPPEPAEVDNSRSDDLEEGGGEAAARPQPDDAETPVLAADSEIAEEELPDPGTSTLDAILSPAPAPLPPQAAAEMDLSDEDRYYLALAKRRAMGKKRVSLDPGIPPHLEIRRYAAALLANVPRSEVCTALIAALGEADGELERAALGALAHQASRREALPTTALEALQNFLGDGDEKLCALVIRAIASITGPEAEAHLDQALTDPSPAVRLEAVRALDRRELADARLEAALSDVWPGVRLAAATAMAHHRGAEALAPLIGFAFAQAGAHRREAGQLLAQVAPSGAVRAFLGVLADESRKREWLVAIEALDEILAAVPPLGQDRKVA